MLIEKKSILHCNSPSLIQYYEKNLSIYLSIYGVARGVIVIVVGNEHGDTSSNPGRNSLHFT